MGHVMVSVHAVISEDLEDPSSNPCEVVSKKGKLTKESGLGNC